ncbi:hypothetical protein N1031_05435 [Herbiconiux moechotypicola]|uniref:Transmembrane protein n=1 Tax=Herbiconiux moechotypicola TaxID=637393 RepID=A0ABN3DDK0_9MICO|nr:hypothetical protein [Herbiconiux moechotypicola]MCS5729198.1 hypothetical protein [Herbiconiux moechotypicola]
MAAVLTSTLRLAAARWPVLLAWFLAGWLVRYLVIEVAAFFGATSSLLGLLILPLAILARLGSFIAMFLVLRGDMPAFRELRATGGDAVDRTATGPRQRVTEIVLVSILPFFAFYAAWQLLADDVREYAEKALGNIDYFADDAAGAGSRVLELQLDVWTIVAIVVAFTGRFLLKRYAAKLPRWTNLVAVYLESVWVFLTLFLISNYTGQFQNWIDTRAGTVWFESVKDAAFDLVAPLAWIWHGAEWAIGEAGALVLLPLAWLTLAGIVYGRALAKPTVALQPTHRYYTGVRDRMAALPKGVLRRARDVGADLTDRWRPLADALLLIWRAGVVPMGLFVLAYTVIDAAGSWLLLAGVRLIGPHELGAFWMNFDAVLIFVVNAVLEPLRLCLIAAAYDFCLRKLEERREAAAQDASAQDAGGAVTAT